MTAEGWFRIANMFVLPGWLLLAIAPRWPWTQTLASRVIPITLSLGYLTILTSQWGGSNGGGSLTAVRQLFANDWLLLGGWVHYLAFDLLTGSRISSDCFHRKIPPWAVAPCLFLTLMFGPVGWLSYLLVREAHTRIQATERQRNT